MHHCRVLALLLSRSMLVIALLQRRRIVLEYGVGPLLLLRQALV